MSSTNSLEAVTVSYSEEQFDPPSSKRKRQDEEDENASGAVKSPQADDEDAKSQQIHRSAQAPHGSYNDALLLASLSDDQDHDDKTRTADSSAMAAPTAETPRRSNASSQPDARGFILHPKPASHLDTNVDGTVDTSTPQQAKDVKKKVTPDRGDSASRPTGSGGYSPARSPYGYPPYNGYPGYGYPHRPVPASAQPPPPGATASQRESDSPLPYHPLSHVVPRYEDWYGYDRYGYYPPPSGHGHPHGPPYPVPSNHPASTATNTSASNLPNSSSPPRVKPWVSMDENSPRTDYHPYPSAAPPGTPIHPPGGRYDYAHHPMRQHHPGHPYEYYPYDHYGNEYSTPPPPNYEHGRPWDHSQNTPQGAHPHAANQPPSNGAPLPATTQAATHPIAEGDNRKHQFRKGARGMHSEPVILRKKFSWRNYPEVCQSC